MRSLVLPLWSAAVAVGGCAAPGGDVQDADTTATTTSAVVVVERTSDATQGTRAEASARFVRVAAPASASLALQSVGAGLDLPAPGACAPVSSLGGGGGDPPPVAELLDVGTVSVEANGLATRLVPRQLPDVTDVVSGVVYARAADATLLPSQALYGVHIGGGGAVEAFDLSFHAPADPADVRVAAQDTDAGPVIVGTGAVSIEWSDDGSGDAIYVDVAPSGVRCHLDSGGVGTVPAAYFDDAGTLSVHRLHREPLRTRGIDAGEIRFDFARAIAYARR